MCLAGGMGLIRLPAWHVVRCVLRFFFLRGWVGVTAPIPLPLTVSEEWMKRNGERDGEGEGDLRRGGGVGGTQGECGGGLCLSGQLS